jgi:hypothetical protein
MKYELRRLSFGETLGQAFNLYFDNFVPLFMISLVGSLPTILFIHTTGIGLTGEMARITVLSVLIPVLLYLSMTTLCTALIIELISKRYLKQHQGMGQYIQNVLPFIFPIIGLTLLEVLIIGLGFVAFIIPGIYLALALIVASQALIVERKRVGESISRSFFLTKGKKLEILGFWLILFLFNYMVREIMKALFEMIGRIDAVVQTKLILIYVIAHLTDILITPISSCVFILIYFNLKIEKEGFDLEHLVDQFGTSSPLPSSNDREQKTENR